jgi:class 3 adenylate cyclase/tetratricopeptide (TPR) repeat protein
METPETAALAAAITALETQRATLGDAVLELALAPLRARLAALQRPAGVQLRRISVLFADVVGSTALASGLDAEDTLALLNETLRRMATVVEAHQGRVLRFTGDGLKAAFGMDDTREDDPARAVHAGLAILSAGREQAETARVAHGIADFAVRVGVHTGDVALGAGVEADNTAMGVAVNIAARMEQSAPPGALRISQDTWSHVRGLFELVPQPPLQVKGVEAPMLTYLVHAALDRALASVERGIQGLRTPLVGRAGELQGLRQTVALAEQTCRLQALTLVADAGLGKSRLLHELIGTLHSVRVLTVRSQPDGLLRPWGLLRSLLATQCGVADTDSAEQARRKVVDGLAPWFAEDGMRRAQLVGQLAGLDFGDSPQLRGLDPRSLRDQAFAAFQAWLLALAASDGRPPLLLVEDLHWMDEGSLDLLLHLQAQGADLPLALVMTTRPALLTRRPGWGAAGATLPLLPLNAAQGDLLAQTLLQRLGSVPPKLTELIVGRAEGNPYYMEELVRRLIDDGAIVADEAQWMLREERLQTLRLPGTLVGLLQARLDALPAGERLAARQASVIGHVFWDEALQALNADAPRALPALQHAAFVRPHATSDFEGTAEHQFDHHLLHQVTYDTLLKAERRLGHGAAARWLAGRTKGRGAEFLAMTGEHAERAGETALAVTCFEQAGREAQKRYANAAAAAWLRRAVTLLGDEEPARGFRLLVGLEEVADTLADRATQQALHQEMAAHLARHPDDTLQAHHWFARGRLADHRGEPAEAERWTLLALDLAERCRIAKTAAMSRAQWGWLKFTRKDFAGAQLQLELGLPWAGQIADEADRAETECKLLLVLAMAMTYQDRLDEGMATAQAVLERGQAHGLPRLQLGALDALVGVYWQRGQWDQVIVTEEQALGVARSIGAGQRIALAQLHLAEAAEALGDTAPAMRWHAQLLPVARAQGSRVIEAASLQYQGRLQHQQGELQAALQLHGQARAVYEALGDDVGACEAAAQGALIEDLLGRRDAALVTVNRLLAPPDGGDPAELPAHETIAWRWACQQVLARAGDERAAPLLEQLFVDVQARAAVLTDAADRERLIHSRPVFRAVAAAHRSSSSGTRP